jgi:hypothetical protein
MGCSRRTTLCPGAAQPPGTPHASVWSAARLNVNNTQSSALSVEHRRHRVDIGTTSCERSGGRGPDVDLCRHEGRIVREEGWRVRCGNAPAQVKQYVARYELTNTPAPSIRNLYATGRAASATLSEAVSASSMSPKMSIINGCPRPVAIAPIAPDVPPPSNSLASARRVAKDPAGDPEARRWPTPHARTEDGADPVPLVRKAHRLRERGGGQRRVTVQHDGRRLFEIIIGLRRHTVRRHGGWSEPLRPFVWGTCRTYKRVKIYLTRVTNGTAETSVVPCGVTTAEPGGHCH